MAPQALRRPLGWLMAAPLLLLVLQPAPEVVAQSPPPRYYMVSDLGPGDAFRVRLMVAGERHSFTLRGVDRDAAEEWADTKHRELRAQADQYHECHRKPPDERNESEQVVNDEPDHEHPAGSRICPEQAENGLTDPAEHEKPAPVEENEIGSG